MSSQTLTSTNATSHGRRRIRPGTFQADRFMHWSMNAYLGFFLLYLFVPLMIMVVAAFNENRIPSVTEWQGTTLHWFEVLFQNERMWQAVLNSLVIGAGVVVMSLTFGLAGALLLSRLHSRANTLFYAILVSPLLTPGIILGISTLIFWNNFGVPGGLFLTVVAQSTFISAYCMLLFLARLQRFDPALEEAALDLGASHRQVFYKITLPFLKPAILSGGVIAFLQSFENYNTTLFAIGSDYTLTTNIASRVKMGLTPEINALGVIFIAVTLVLSIVYEIRRRRSKPVE
ncbi:ABC transporter permease [Balneatrix alpica]|uniref:ABC transporter permease n=1 Tax=Balneatrix alpica TaxID=75684 RepID=A0ABV5Z6E6_9GAMM|nr:ABC transporter permease [Balneatrix alpica]